MSKASLSSRELARRFGWGDLKDHYSTCPDCDGTGRDGGESCERCGNDGTERDERDAVVRECPDCPDPCLRCSGGEEAGRIRWGSFYVADHGECQSCRSKHELPVAAMYDNGEGEVYVCLRCYIRDHRRVCGCALWSAADACVPDARPARARYRRTAHALGWRMRRDGPDADAARAEVIEALKVGGGVQVRAAAIVGMCRDRFARLLARHDLTETARQIRNAARVSDG